MGFWDWAAQGQNGDNLICLGMVVVAGVVAVVALLKGVRL